uniref:Uncharacterized protein n=1 Tax=Rhizophora mucronata TaxID=61149 RepID=A0A2P2PFI3_RHIMU
MQLMNPFQDSSGILLPHNPEKIYTGLIFICFKKIEDFTYQKTTHSSCEY